MLLNDIIDIEKIFIAIDDWNYDIVYKDVSFYYSPSADTFCFKLSEFDMWRNLDNVYKLGMTYEELLNVNK